MKKVLEYIEDHLFEELSIKQLAEVANYSPFHFLRSFQSFISIPPMEYIRKRRLTESARKVIKGEDKIIQLAFECGYKSEAAYIRAFKQQFGISPGQMKREKYSTSGGFFPPITNFIEKKSLPPEQMHFCFITLPAFSIIGYKSSVVMDNSFEEGLNTPNMENIERFKNRLIKEGNKKLPDTLYSYFELAEESNKKQIFNFIEGFRISDLNFIPDGFELIHIPDDFYIQFSIDIIKTDFIAAEKYIYNEWFPKSKYKQSKDYTLGTYCDIYLNNFRELTYHMLIPVCEKN